MKDQIREILDDMRGEILSADGISDPLTPPPPSLPDTAEEEIESRLRSRLSKRNDLRLKPVINATGVILHTNLGRAPLSSKAVEAIKRIAGEYCTLEYDVSTGKRGKRGIGVETMLHDLVNCEAAVVVNNCAAAVLLILNTIAEGGEVIISRGELVEIGGEFRIPDVIEKSGARIREVGSTNRTRLSDYEKAINENTRLILRIHPSNYRIIGFTEKPEINELAILADNYNLPLYEDMGCGLLLEGEQVGINSEPSVASSLNSGCSIVSFSGDKLLGGPQAGIILGKAELIERVKRNPLMRALRVDKLIYAALEATIESYATDNALNEIPILKAIHTPKEEITRRARLFIRKAKTATSSFEFKLIDGNSVAGGGSVPMTEFPTTLITITSNAMSASEIEAKLRMNDPPIITRIVDNQIVIDLRTVTVSGEKEIIEALKKY